MSGSRIVIACWLFIALIPFARAEIISALPTAQTTDKRIALTFDACEAWDVVHFDEKLINYLTTNRIPVTIFVTGRFAKSNPDALKTVSELPFVEIGNHSYDHPNNMDAFTQDHVADQVLKAEAEIEKVTAKKPVLFRFPAGNYSADALEVVEALGYKTVHWRWPSGDPDRTMTASRLQARVSKLTRPNDVLIFHINGRGWHTAEAMPTIIEGLKSQGYRFVTVSEGLTAPARPTFRSVVSKLMEGLTSPHNSTTSPEPISH